MARTIYTRRIQRTGGSTFVVSLPKAWIRRAGLGSGSILYIEEELDGSLRVYPYRREATVEYHRKIIVDPGLSTGNVIREVISSYLAGYTSVEVEFSPNSSVDREKLKRIIESSIIGFNVIEETPGRILFYNVAYPSNLPLFKALGNAFRVSLSMLNDCISGLKRSDKELLKSVGERDDLVDKLYMLVVRQLNEVLLGRRNPRDLGLESLPETLYVFLGAKSIERVADHATLIASHGSATVERGVPEAIVEALEDATEIFDKSARSFIYLNKEGAMKVALLVEEFWDKQRELLRKLNTSHSPETVYFIVDSIRRIAGYSLDLAESVIDIVTIRMAEKEQKRQESSY
ncbi:MAG: hypothetical protein F7C07_05500 [Desulfurococcales archaeon]|nr:hypothetical protein [Desulfurococcales archaeon]